MSSLLDRISILSEEVENFPLLEAKKFTDQFLKIKQEISNGRK